MTQSADSSLIPIDFEAIFGLPSLERQIDFLQSAGLMNPAGLSRLLDEAARLARRDPGKARQLTVISAEASVQAGAPTVLPRALYVRAQTHAINGEFTSALELIQASRSEFEAIGEEMEALRTNLGLIHVLNELGRHQEALGAAQAILDALEAKPDLSPPARTMLAIAHTNRGICYETIGQYEEALQAFEFAEMEFEKMDLTERIGDVSNNRGIVLVHLGRIRESLMAFQKAYEIWSKAGLTLLTAQAMSNIGEAHLALGNYSQSLVAFEQARESFEHMDAQANQGILLRKTADAYLALNLYPEALDLYRKANRFLEASGMVDHLGRGLWGLGAGLIAQGMVEEAAEILKKAADVFEAAGNTPMLSSVLLEQSALWKRRGDAEAALEKAKKALELVSKKVWPVQRIYAHLRLADLHFPDLEASEAQLDQAQDLAQILNLPTIQYRLDSRFGHLRLLQGRIGEALNLLEAAVQQVETLRFNLAHESIRTSFLQDKTAVFDDLIRLHLDRNEQDDVHQAFSVAERAKSRTLVDLLTGTLPAGPISPEDSEGASRMRMLQSELNATYNRFLEPPESGTDFRLPDLQAKAASLEREINQLRLRAIGAVDRSDLFEIPFSQSDLQGQLSGELCLLSYHILGEEILAFILRSDSIEVIRNLARPSLVQDLLQRLQVQWDRFRVGEDFVKRHMSTLEKTTQRILADLYLALFAPLEEVLGSEHRTAERDPKPLVIVPHGFLHQIPFQALYDGENYLIDLFEISFTLSATVFTLCQAREPSTEQHALVVGMADSWIPAVDLEASAVAERLASSEVPTRLLIGDQARKEFLLASTYGYSILHLACHGMFRADNPMFSALKFSDGWLTAAEAAQMRLNSSLVTLSACESGRSRVYMGEEVIGLPRAFLGAGAASVLVSLWVVPDSTTAVLMDSWYEQLLAGKTRAGALAEAQKSVREDFPHPYYWAPFILVGKR
jgi:CHAT domain-containing protein/Tfp pilus assembly protein PilF